MPISAMRGLRSLQDEARLQAVYLRDMPVPAMPGLWEGKKQTRELWGGSTQTREIVRTESASMEVCHVQPKEYDSYGLMR